MKKLLIFVLLALPYSTWSQDPNAIVFDTTSQDFRTYFSFEKSFMSQEEYVMFNSPQGRVSFSNEGYITYWDSIGNSQSQDVDCGVYPVIKTITDSIFLRQYEFYWYSQKHWEMKTQQKEASIKDYTQSTHFATINGEPFTCNAPPEYILKTYRKAFPDVVLVNKLPSGHGDIKVW